MGYTYTISTGNFVRGDSNNDGSVNVADVIFIVQWLFVQGPTPQCLDAADGTNVRGQLWLMGGVGASIAAQR